MYNYAAHTQLIDQCERGARVHARAISVVSVMTAFAGARGGRIINCVQPTSTDCRWKGNNFENIQNDAVWDKRIVVV